MAKSAPYNVSEYQKHAAGFEQWLSDNGATIITPTNEWEVLRVRGQDKRVHILYKKKTGRLNWPDLLRGAFHAHKNGGKFKGFGPQKQKSTKLVGRLKTVYQRSQGRCFYCGEKVSNEDASIEHLLSQCHGGGNDPANLVLAHKACNNMADNLTVYEKVKLRESKMKLMRPVELEEQNAVEAKPYFGPMKFISGILGRAED